MNELDDEVGVRADDRHRARTVGSAVEDLPVLEHRQTAQFTEHSHPRTTGSIPSSPVGGTLLSRNGIGVMDIVLGEFDLPAVLVGLASQPKMRLDFEPPGTGEASSSIMAWVSATRRANG
ncbi:hypothetical protein [Mycobacterium antarcticum]|uniref:hypothetical protein n=1 Tax=unclassified Mycolicibacterium TaxID=2636767 RepID=UPI0024E0B3D9|nr:MULTISPECIES: hypothetical protein [unclassified Mycolicibacterium]